MSTEGVPEEGGVSSKYSALVFVRSVTSAEA